MSTPVSQPRYLVIARIARPHGVRGELRVQAVTAFPDRMYDLESVVLATDPEDESTFSTHRVDRIRPDKDSAWLMHLEGVADRDAAERFRGRFVLVSLAEAVPLEANEVYLFQVMGLQARTPEGQPLGRVAEIIETGANLVYVLRDGPYGEVLIPAISGVIVNIDPEKGEMIVDPLPGLLPE